jgi:predicted ATPase
MDDLYIRGIKLEDSSEDGYPFSIAAVQALESMTFTQPVTFLVGENGTGKSTIIEAIAVAAGFNAEGGTKNYSFSSQDTTSELSDILTLVRGHRREKYGYFLRAESFYTAANYAENGTFDTSGNPIPLLFQGNHIHEQSHGEAFLSIVNSFSPGLFIFDEPESALSPQRLLSLMLAMRQLIEQGSQFIIATHSPILLGFPDATIYQLSPNGIKNVQYNDIDHVKLTKDFLNNPKSYLDKLLDTRF